MGRPWNELPGSWWSHHSVSVQEYQDVALGDMVEECLWCWVDDDL